MTVLPVIKVGHPSLRQTATLVEKFDQELIELMENMVETMRISEGIGLAAPQVNIMLRMFVIDKKLINEEWEAQAYINPEIIDAQGLDSYEEGCLSIPGIRAEVDRPFKVWVKYQTIEGKIIEEELEGLLARVFQHEYDHLDGILFIDRIPFIRKKMLESQINEIEGAYS
jgi:peptide deformylase